MRADEINMCEAIEKMMNDREKKGKVEVLAGLVKDSLLNVKDAAARLGMTLEDFEAAMKKLS